MTATTPFGTPHFVGLQSLRALAALMVLIGHVIAEAEHYMGFTLDRGLIPWTRGVDIFFVISGVIITLSGTRFISQPSQFLWRRALRLVPLYYLFTTLMVITLLVLPDAAKETMLDPKQILSSYGFVPYERHDGRVAPVLSLGWTLNYEMLFYALFAVCLALPYRHLTITSMLIGLGAIGGLVAFESAQLTFWTNPIVIEFLFGIALARVWQAGWYMPSGTTAVVLMIAGVCLLIALDRTGLPRFIAAGLPAAMFVAAGTLFCPPIATPWQGLGDASYALYLSHRFTLRVLTLVLLPTLPMSAFGATLFIFIACSACIGMSLLIHHQIEQPLLRLLSTPRGKEATS